MSAADTKELLITDLTGKLGPAAARRFEREVRDTENEEKARYELRQATIQQSVAALGSHKIEGLGQRVAVMDARTWFRWWMQYPGCWNDNDFEKTMLRDNPSMRAPGYHG